MTNELDPNDVALTLWEFYGVVQKTRPITWQELTDSDIGTTFQLATAMGNYFATSQFIVTGIFNDYRIGMYTVYHADLNDRTVSRHELLVFDCEHQVMTEACSIQLQQWKGLTGDWVHPEPLIKHLLK